MIGRSLKISFSWSLWSLRLIFVSAQAQAKAQEKTLHKQAIEVLAKEERAHSVFLWIRDDAQLLLLNFQVDLSIRTSENF